MVYKAVGLDKIPRWFIHQLVATIICNLGVVAAGAGFAWLEPLTQWLTTDESHVKMTSNDVAWLVSTVEFGELAVVVPCGVLADRWGRKPVILSIGPMCVISWLIVKCTSDIVSLYIVRFIQGLALGIAFTVVPMYVAEISSPSVRGSLGGQFTVLWFIGILFAYCTGHYLNYDTFINTQFYVPVVFFFTFLLMPESPYYYFMRKQPLKAAVSLKWLRYGQDVVDEVNTIEKSVEEDMQRKGSWRDLIATKSDRRALFIVQIVCAVRYLTGMPVYITYATQTFASGTQTIITPDQLTIAMGVVMCASAFISSIFSDTVGRRPLMIGSSIGIFLFNTILAIYYYLDEHNIVDTTAFVWVMYMSVAGFCISLNTGVGQLMQTVQAEFFPSHTRGIGGGVTGITTSIATFVNLILYQYLTDTFGVYMNFVTFAVFSLIGVIQIMKYVTESAGKSLAEINSNIKEITANE